MKMLIAAVAIMILLCVTQSAFAQLGAPHSKNPQAAYQSGFKYGVIDAKKQRL